MPIDEYIIKTDMGDHVRVKDPFIDSNKQVDSSVGEPIVSDTENGFTIHKIDDPLGYTNVENKLYDHAMEIMRQPRGPREQKRLEEQKQHYLEMLSKAPSFDQVIEQGFKESLTGELFTGASKLTPYTQQWDLTNTAIKDVTSFASDAWVFFLLSLGVGEAAEATKLSSKIGKFAANTVQSGAVLGSYGGLRQTVTDAILHNWSRSPSDFLASAGRALSRAARDTATGLAVGAVGELFSKVAKPFIDKSVEDAITVALGGEARSFASRLKTAAAARLIKETGVAAEGLVFGTMTPLLNGRIPSKREIIQGLVDLYGIRAVNSGSGYAFDAFRDFRDAYVRHGVTPQDIIRQARHDASILQDAANETITGFRIFTPLHQLGEAGTRTIEIPEGADPHTKEILQAAKEEQEANRRLKMVYDARKEVYDLRVELASDQQKSKDEGLAIAKSSEGEKSKKEGVAIANTSKAEFADIPTPSEIVDAINAHIEDGNLDKATQYAEALINERLLTMPDLVNIVHELTKGNFPQIKKIIEDDLKIQGAFVSGYVNRQGKKVFYRSPEKLKILLKSDIFKNPSTALRTLAHEIGHLVSWFPKRIMVEHHSDTLRMISGLRDIHNLFQRAIADGRTTSEKASEVYAKIDEELTDASSIWRPWPKKKIEKKIADGTVSKKEKEHYDYRMSAVERIADAIAVILNQPMLAKTLMPVSTKMFHQFLDRRPEVKQVYDDLMDSIIHEANLENAENRVLEDFEDGEQRMIHKEEQDKIRAQMVERFKRMRNAAIYDNKFAAILNPKFGYKLSDPVVNKIQKLYHYDSISQNYIDQMERHVLKKMKVHGYSSEDVGLALFYRRISEGDRQKFANARGFTPAEADARLKVLESNKKFIKEVTDGFYKVRKEYVLPEILKSDVVPDRLKNAVKRNPKYARFFVTKFIDHEWGPNTAASMFGGKDSIAFADLESIEKAQKGYLGEVANPFFMTMVNDVALMRAIRRQETINAVIDALRKQAPEDILTEKEFNSEKLKRQRAANGKLNSDYESVPYIRKVPKTVTDPETGEEMIVYTTDENGNQVVATELQKEFYHVLSPIMDGFKSKNPGIAVWLSNLAGGKVQQTLDVSNKIFRLLVITTNTGFILRNAFYRDNMRTVLNLPGLGPLKAYKLVPFVKSTYEEVYKYMTKGELSDDVRNSIYEGLWSTAQNYEGRDSISTNPMETMLRRYGKNLSEYDAKVTRNVKTLSQRFDDATAKLDVVNDFFEKANKLLAYKFLKANQEKLGITNDEVEMMVRMAAASPDFMERGTGSHVINAVIPFANAVMKAYKGNFFAARRLGYRAYAFRIGTSAILLGLISAMAEKHLFDWNFWPDNAKPGEVIAGVTKYKRDHYFIIPKNINSEGKSVALVVPLPDRVDFRIPYVLTRSIVKLFADKAKNGDRDAAQWLNEIYRHALQPTLGFGENELLGFSPIISSTKNFTTFVTDNNYFDSYKVRMKYTDKEVRQFQSNPVKAYRRFFADQLQLFGFQRDFMRWLGGDMQTAEQEGNALSKFIGMATDGILGSFIYVGDWGIHQELQDREIERARLKQEASDIVRRKVSGGSVSPEDLQHAEQFGSRAMVISAQHDKEIIDAIKQTPKQWRSWTNWYLHASKDGKLDVIDMAKKNPAGREWINWMQREHGLVSQ